jgi:signal peptidase
MQEAGSTGIRPGAALAAALLLVAVFLGWVFFAPPQLGGQTAYVIVNGNSMEPGMHRGDLALVRPADDYRPGDVVTYRHPELGFVIHRIVSEEGGRFTLKGDHNDFLDSYHPTRGEVVGRLWFHVPGLGRVFWHLRSPLWGGLVLVVAFAGLLGGSAAGTARTTARPARGSGEGRNRMNTVVRNWQDTLVLLVAAALAFGLLAWVGFARGLEKVVPAERSYTQRGTFSYEAASIDGRIYDAGRATTGEPVYLRLSDTVTFTFAYELSSAGTADVGGTYQLVAEVGDASGWKRTIPLTEPGSFKGTTFETTGTLRLADVLDQIATLEAQSEVRNDRYTVTIRPRVNVEGELAGVPLKADFDAAALPLSLDRSRLWLNSGNPETVLAPVETGVATAPQRVTNSVQVWFVSVPVLVARLAGIAGAVLAMGAAVALLIAAAKRGWGHDHGTQPVRIAGGTPLEAAEVIDVATLDDLERVAERIGGVVLQQIQPDAHICYVRDGAVVYRYSGPPLEYGTERAA